MVMNYPTFFKTRPIIKLQDPLQGFLGTFENGIIEFSYLDIVKSAGHSCPTVTGAYLMTLKGLKALYKDELPVRGEVVVSFSDDASEGVTGVIANVISQITGATKVTGFKGIQGKFSRNNLLNFNVNFNGNVKFQRVDTNQAVIVHYDPSSIPTDPRQKELMAKIVQKKANQQEEIEFEVLWQHRVEKIFNHVNEVIEVEVI